MLIYFLIVVLILAFSLVYKKLCELDSGNKYFKLYKVICLTAMILTLSIFYAVRGLSVGTDTKAYNHIFNYLADNFDSSLFHYEIGFTLLSSIIYAMSPSFTLFMFVVGVIMFSCIIFANYKLSKNPVLSNILFITFGFYMQSFNIIRQYLAISFILIGLYFLIKKNNNWLFLLFVLIASLFHKTAVVAGVILILKYVKFETMYVLILSVVMLLGILLLPQISNVLETILHTSYFKTYLPLMGDISTTDLLLVAMAIVCVVVAIILRSYLKKKNKDFDIVHYDMYVWLLTLFCFIKVASIFTIENIDRLGAYFLIAILFFIPLVIEELFKSRKELWSWIICVFSVICMVIMIQVIGVYGAYPYVFI